MGFRIGIMQGRLSKPINGKIQSFPKNSWENEFYLAKDIGFELIEHTRILSWDLCQKLEEGIILFV